MIPRREGDAPAEPNRKPTQPQTRFPVRREPHPPMEPRQTMIPGWEGDAPAEPKRKLFPVRRESHPPMEPRQTMIPGREGDAPAEAKRKRTQPQTQFPVRREPHPPMEPRQAMFPGREGDAPAEPKRKLFPVRREPHPPENTLFMVSSHSQINPPSYRSRSAPKIENLGSQTTKSTAFSFAFGKRPTCGELAAM